MTQGVLSQAEDLFCGATVSGALTGTSFVVPFLIVAALLVRDLRAILKSQHIAKRASVATADVLSDLIVILFPFSIYVIVGAFTGDMAHPLVAPEASVASAVLFGTTALRLHRLLIYLPDTRREAVLEKYAESQALLLLGLLVSVTSAALIAAQMGSEYFVAALQGAMLALAIRAFVLKGILVSAAHQQDREDRRDS
jgi:hypothetical protein